MSATGTPESRSISRRTVLAAAGVGVAAATLAQGQPAHTQTGKLDKEVVNLGMPWKSSTAMPRRSRSAIWSGSPAS
jgi:hypothetical protein